MTKKELIKFLDGLVELVSEENRARAVLVKERFLSDFEKSYGFEKEVMAEVSKLPPHQHCSNAGFCTGRNQAESNSGIDRTWRMYS